MSLVETVVEQIKLLGGKPGEFRGMVSVTVNKKEVVNAVKTAKDAGFEMISDIFGLDYLEYPGHQGKRFTVAYNLYSLSNNERIFIRVNLDDGETLPTITHLWKGANFMEREVYDMFGVEFEGHPNLRKLITPEDLDGHPHRKDFPLGDDRTGQRFIRLAWRRTEGSTQWQLETPQQINRSRKYHRVRLRPSTCVSTSGRSTRVHTVFFALLLI
jgi:NADH-quinone oxidoreductase subunit C